MTPAEQRSTLGELEARVRRTLGIPVHLAIRATETPDRFALGARLNVEASVELDTRSWASIHDNRDGPEAIGAIGALVVGFRKVLRSAAAITRHVEPGNAVAELSAAFMALSNALDVEIGILREHAPTAARGDRLQGILDMQVERWRAALALPDAQQTPAVLTFEVPNEHIAPVHRALVSVQPGDTLTLNVLEDGPRAVRFTWSKEDPTMIRVTLEEQVK